MIGPILAKLYGSTLEKKIIIWIEIQRKRAYFGKEDNHMDRNPRKRV
jgi:hypothetical protein